MLPADLAARADRLVSTTQAPTTTHDRRCRTRTYPKPRAVELLELPLMAADLAALTPPPLLLESYNKSDPHALYNQAEGWTRDGWKPSPNDRFGETEMPDADKLKSLKSSRYRAKARIKDRCLMMGAKVLMTLTTRGAYSVDQLWPLVREFTKRLHRELPEASFIEVPELHSSGGANHGGCHFHVPCSHFIPASKARRIWHEVLTGTPGTKHGQASPGNIDLQYRQHGDAADMAYYVVKRLAGYITKDIEAEKDGALLRKGQKRYRCSGKPIPPTPETTFYVGPDVDIGELFEQLTGQRVKGQHIELADGRTATSYRTERPVSASEYPSAPLSAGRS